MMTSLLKWWSLLGLSIIVLLTVLQSVMASHVQPIVREVCLARRLKLIEIASEHRRRLHAVREQMIMRASLQGPEIDGYILPSFDEHLNAEMAFRDRRLFYLTGFSGVGAIATITNSGAALWIEPRYLRQADAEITCDWDIFTTNNTFTIADWFQHKLPSDRRIGVDPHLVPHYLWRKWDKQMRLNSLKLVKVNNNLVDLIWGPERPNPHPVTIKVHERLYAGEKWEDKVTQLRHTMAELQCDAIIVTSLTEIAYLLNIRGRDLPYTPVVKAYLIVTGHEITLYVDRRKVSENIELHLHTDCFNENCVKIKDYHQIWSDIRTNVQIWKRVFIPARCVQDYGTSEAVFSSVPSKLIYEEISPIIFMRAEKNTIEQEGMRMAHIRDGAAICEAMSNLENRFASEIWTEEKVKFEIERSRLSQEHAKGLSMATIVAYGEHSAIPFYVSSNVTNIEVTNQSLLIIESGSQYLEGTTDVTRTYIFGKPTREMKDAYTRVLAGILQLSRLKFPHDLKPSEVDALVRSPVWGTMTDYPQPTGHGIGAYSAVQEPPISMAYGEENSFLFKEGYFFSGESGYYKSGDFGLRLKNVLQVMDTGRWHTSGAKFLEFDDITLVPYEPKLIDGALLNVDQKKFLNSYNAKIREFIGQELKRQGNMQAFYWMMQKTEHIIEYLPEEEYRGKSGASIKMRGFLTITVPATLLGLTVFCSFLRWLL